MQISNIDASLDSRLNLFANIGDQGKASAEDFQPRFSSLHLKWMNCGQMRFLMVDYNHLLI